MTYLKKLDLCFQQADKVLKFQTSSVVVPPKHFLLVLGADKRLQSALCLSGFRFYQNNHRYDLTKRPLLWVYVWQQTFNLLTPAYSIITSVGLLKDWQKTIRAMRKAPSFRVTRI